MINTIEEYLAMKFLTMKMLVALCLCLAASSALLECVCGAEVRPPGYLLDGPDFRLSAHVTTFKEQRTSKKDEPTLMIQNEFVTEEFYSTSQKRAVVELHKLDGGQVDPHLIFHHYNGVTIQNPMQGRSKCVAVDRDQLAREALGMRQVSDDWTKTRAEVPDYIIGLARLLFIVDHRRDSLFAARDAQEDKLRNHKTVKYQVRERFGFQSTLEVWYADTRGFDLPMRLKFTNNDASIVVVDFSSIGPLTEDLLEQSDSKYPLDMFAFPVGIGCSEKLKPISEPEWRTDSIEVASFQAQIYHYDKFDSEQSTISNRFVAYDLMAGAIRSDTSTSNTYSSSIIDLHKAKKYNILTANRAESNPPEGRQCVASNLPADRLSVPLLPFHKLVYMGRASVRGVECDVFEQITNVLPFVLFPQLTYTNLKGEYETIFERNPSIYSLVYYFASSGDRRQMARRDPLVRLDVYSENSLKYQMDVFNYVAQLVSAPNGDPDEELFALKDRCSSGTYGYEGYATLSLELLYRSPSNDGGKTDLNQDPKTKAQKALRNLHVRNKAIMRAITRASPWVATKLYDIESQMKLSSSGELRIYVTAQLNMPDAQVYEVRQIGWSSYDWPTSDVKTLEECFQRAAHARSDSSPVLFYGCGTGCHLDLAPGIQFDKDGKTIKSIKAHLDGPERDGSTRRSCPAMLVEPIEKQPVRGIPDDPLARLYYEIDGKRLALLMPHEGIFDKDHGDMVFGVVKAEVSNDRWSAALSMEKAQPVAGSNTETIDGLGLSATIGQLQEPRQKEAAPDDEPVMSQQMCHSICMADLSCRSFSICLTRGGVECITSAVDFRDATLLKAIEEERAKESEGSSLKSRTISVPNPKKTADATIDDDETAKFDQIVLRADFRCKLYKKNMLDMFQKILPQRVTLKNSALIPVDNQEQCAEICLHNNMAFFRRMSETKAEILQNNGRNLADPETIRQLRGEYNTNIMSWCSTFHFLDSSSAKLDREARAYVDPKKLTKGGLCVTVREDSIRTPAKTAAEQGVQVEKVGPHVLAETFEIVYTNLFDAHYGIRLIAALSEGEESQPLSEIMVYSSKVEYCAQTCFMQTSGVRPWCRSFDYIEERILTTYDAALYRYCVFHAVSLADIRAGYSNHSIEDLILSGKSKTHGESVVYSWHYDSRDTYTLESAVLANTFLATKERMNLLSLARNFSLHTFGVLTILLAAVALSATVVVANGESIMERFNCERHGSISNPSSSFLGTVVSGSNPTATATSGGSSAKKEKFFAGDNNLPDIPVLI